MRTGSLRGATTVEPGCVNVGRVRRRGPQRRVNMLPWLLTTLLLAAPQERPAPRAPERTGQGMLIAGGVLLTVGAMTRLGVEAFWWTRTELPPGDRFGRWSVPNIEVIANLGNLLFVAPGLGLLLAGEHRYGRWEAVRHRADGSRRKDIPRLRRTGFGLLGAGLAVLVLGRALFLPWTHTCTTNACAYGLLETTYWTGAGMTVAGAAMATYARGYDRTWSKGQLKVAPLAGPGIAGLVLGGKF
jgi:hypothetical protein